MELHLNARTLELDPRGHQHQETHTADQDYPAQCKASRFMRSTEPHMPQIVVVVAMAAAPHSLHNPVRRAPQTSCNGQNSRADMSIAQKSQIYYGHMMVEVLGPLLSPHIAAMLSRLRRDICGGSYELPSTLWTVGAY